MREILFRGKTESGRWAYGSLIYSEEDDYCCILEKYQAGNAYNWPYLDGKFGAIDGQATPVDPETVGQSTGLYDRNGKDIFEGDIVDTPRWIVTYLANYNEGTGMNAGWYIQRDDFESWEELECRPYHRILGNIYDNSELLEG